MKQTKGGQPVSTGDQYKRFLWTGIVKARPVKFNPTASEIEAIRGFKPEQEPQYSNLTSQDGSRYSKLEVIFEFNPKEQKGVTPEQAATYPDKAFVTLSWTISNKEMVGATSGKTRYTNKLASYDGLRSSWANTPEELPVFFEREFKYTGEDGQTQSDELTIQPLREGEYTLYNLLYALFCNEATKDNMVNMDVLETAWEDIVDGDVSELNAILDKDLKSPELAQFRTESGDPNYISLLIGVKTSQSGRQYMTPYCSEYNYSFHKQGRHFSEKRITPLLSIDSPFKSDFQRSQDFKEYDVLKAAQATTTSAQNTTDNYNVDVDSDLPF